MSHDQMYVIKNRGSGRVLDVERGGQVINSPVLLFDKHAQDNQKWSHNKYNQICTALKPGGEDVAIHIHDRSTGQVIMSVCEKDPTKAKDQMWLRNADGTIACYDDPQYVLSAGAGNQGDHLKVEQKGNPPPASQLWDWEAM